MLELRKLRLEKGLTQAELAKKAGVSEISIRKYEDGSRNPKIQTLIKLADVLQVSLSELQYGILPDDISNTRKIVFDNVVDEDHPLNIILKKIENGQALSSEESKMFKEYRVKGLSSLQQYLEIFPERLKESLSSYYSLLNDDGKKEADRQIQETLEKIIAQATNQATDELMTNIQLISRIPEYQKSFKD